MAFTGLHVVCAKSGGPGYKTDGVDLLNGIEWSESPSSNTATTSSAGISGGGKAVFHIYAAADSWVSIGPSGGDPNANPRFIVKANDYFDILVPSGSKLKWVAA